MASLLIQGWTSLQKVARTGSGNKKSYGCGKCAKTFANASNLKRHLVLHTGNFRWYCDICKKRYNQKENYEKHIRAHRGEKYRCENCGKGFSAQSKLKYHMSEHTGEYKFACVKCNKGFNLKPTFEKHVARHEQQQLVHNCLHYAQLQLSFF